MTDPIIDRINKIQKYNSQYNAEMADKEKQDAIIKQIEDKQKEQPGTLNIPMPENKPLPGIIEGSAIPNLKGIQPTILPETSIIGNKNEVDPTIQAAKNLYDVQSIPELINKYKAYPSEEGRKALNKIESLSPGLVASNLGQPKSIGSPGTAEYEQQQRAENLKQIDQNPFVNFVGKGFESAFTRPVGEGVKSIADGWKNIFTAGGFSDVLRGTGKIGLGALDIAMSGLLPFNTTEKVGAEIGSSLSKNVSPKMLGELNKVFSGNTEKSLNFMHNVMAFNALSPQVNELTRATVKQMGGTDEQADRIIKHVSPFAFGYKVGAWGNISDFAADLSNKLVDSTDLNQEDKNLVVDVIKQATFFGGLMGHEAVKRSDKFEEIKERIKYETEKKVNDFFGFFKKGPEPNNQTGSAGPTRDNTPPPSGANGATGNNGFRDYMKDKEAGFEGDFKQWKKQKEEQRKQQNQQQTGQQTYTTPPPAEEAAEPNAGQSGKARTFTPEEQAHINNRWEKLIKRFEKAGYKNFTEFLSKMDKKEAAQYRLYKKLYENKNISDAEYQDFIENIFYKKHNNAADINPETNPEAKAQEGSKQNPFTPPPPQRWKKGDPYRNISAEEFKNLTPEDQTAYLMEQLNLAKQRNAGSEGQQQTPKPEPPKDGFEKANDGQVIKEEPIANEQPAENPTVKTEQTFSSRLTDEAILRKKQDIIDLFDHYKTLDNTTDKRSVVRDAGKIVQELLRNGINAKIQRNSSGKWEFYIDGEKQNKRTLGMVTRGENVDINNIEVSENAAKTFEELPPEVRSNQTILAESFIEPSDLPKGMGAGALKKGIDDIKHDAGRETSPEAKIVREAAEDILQNGKEVQPIKGEKKTSYISPEEIQSHIEQKLSENPDEEGDDSFDFGLNVTGQEENKWYSQEGQPQGEQDIFGNEVEKPKAPAPKPVQEAMFQNERPSMKGAEDYLKNTGKSEDTTPLFQQEPQENPNQQQMFDEEQPKQEQPEEQKAETDDSDYGKGNKIVTKERYEELKKRLRNKLNNLNMAFDPEVLAIGMEMAAFHIESGSRKFADFSKRMIKEFGENIKPYLKAFYNGAKEMPGMENFKKETDAYDIVEKFDYESLKEKPADKPSIKDIANPIGIENQIEDAIEGQSDETKQKLREKVNYAKENLDRISKINGNKPYHVSIDGNDIRYNLSTKGDKDKPKYYYPIQYATIEYSAVPEKPKVSEEPIEPARDKAAGQITGSRVARLEEKGYEIVYGKPTDSEYWEMVGILSGGYADRMKEAGLTIKKKAEEPEAPKAEEKKKPEDLIEGDRVLLNNTSDPDLNGRHGTIQKKYSYSVGGKLSHHYDVKTDGGYVAHFIGPDNVEQETKKYDKEIIPDINFNGIDHTPQSFKDIVIERYKNYIKNAQDKLAKARNSNTKAIYQKEIDEYTDKLNGALATYKKWLQDNPEAQPFLNEEKPKETNDNLISSNKNYTIKEDVDTRDGSKLWVVKIKDRVPPSEFAKIKQDMTKQGGYWSRFKGGFIFKKEPTGLMNTEQKAPETSSNKPNDALSDIQDMFQNGNPNKKPNSLTNDNNNVNLNNEKPNEVNDDAQLHDRPIEGNGKQPLETKPSGTIQGTSTGGNLGGKPAGSSRINTPNVSINQKPTGNDGENSGTSRNDSLGNGEKRDNISQESGGRTGGKRPAESKPNGSNDVGEQGAGNYRLTSEDELENRSPKQKFNDNIQAIELLRKIEKEGRKATAEEQSQLVKYVGWGGMPQAFERDSYRSEIQKLANELYQLVDNEVISEQEYDALRRSTLNAHYTTPKVIKGMYDILNRMGFNGKKILDPSMGIGHFYSAMPDDILRGKSLYGVELDPITGGIAKLLHPAANINIKGFEDTNYKNDSFDLVISNFPFGDYRVFDPAYNKLKLPIHNYFFAKSIDKIRPGGFVIAITSRYTMDSVDSTFRNYMEGKADFIGAIRLPSDSFKKIANTEVTTDILVFQKRFPGEKSKSVAFLNTEKIPLKLKDRFYDKIKGEWVDEGEFPINEYFIQHPEMMLGKLTAEGSMYGANEVTLKPSGPIESLLPGAIDKFPKDIYKVSNNHNEEPINPVYDGSVKPGGYTVQRGKVYRNDGEKLAEVKYSPVDVNRVKDLLDLRDSMRNLLHEERNNPDDDAVNKMIADFNKLYDTFILKWGTIKGRNNRNAKVLQGDPDLPLLNALENYDSDKNTSSKTDIFNKRLYEPQKEISKADTPKDGLLISLNESGKIDIPRISNLVGKSEEDVITELEGQIFEDPEVGFVTSDEYLSGDVKTKLEIAERAAKDEPKYQKNVEALKNILPKDLDVSQIKPALGSSWLPENFIEDYLHDLTGTSKNFSVKYIPETGLWVIGQKQYLPFSTKNNQTYGTSNFSGNELLEMALNHKLPTVWDTEYDPATGKDKRSVNHEKTQLAREKQEQLKDNFKDWIFQDEKRAIEIVKKYNDELNRIVQRSYDGAHLTFPGMRKELTNKLFPHQKNAIWRIIQNRNALLAHTVGAGKTYTMIASAMELKRLGIAKKPAIVTLNSALEQVANDFLYAYPDAKILVASKDDLGKGKRQEFMSRIATGDWDCIIMTQSGFKSLPITNDTQRDYLQKEINEIENIIRALEESKGIKESNKGLIKRLEKAKLNVEKKIKDLMSKAKSDNTIFFEDLGIDQLFIDEAHYYKNLYFPTKITGVAGLGGTRSGIATDLDMKIGQLYKYNDGKGLVLATGTPILNSMSELYIMQRYLQPETLKQYNLKHFDSWAKDFGEIVQKLELSVDGKGFKVRTRFAKFINVPELMNILSEIADIKTANQLNLPKPKLRGEKAEIISIPAYKELDDYVYALAERMKDIQDRKVEPTEDNPLKVAIDGRKAALDLRLVKPDAKESTSTKSKIAADNIYKIWDEAKENKSTQLVFCDFSTPGEGFNIYDDLRNKLIGKGIPANEIEFIHNADSDIAKEELYKKIRAGKVRILIGSTGKMGAGLNVQNKLLAQHHLDVPWRPGDLEQRDGRILRQGNENPEVRIFRYVQEGSFDAYMWQILENKAGSIYQVMEYNPEIREIDDLGSVTVSYAEAKAIASGNPLIMEKVKVDNEVYKLQLLKKNYDSNVLQNKMRISSLMTNIDACKEKLGLLEEDLPRLPEITFDDKNNILINGEVKTIDINGIKATTKQELNTIYDKLKEDTEAQFLFDKISTEKEFMKIGDFTFFLKTGWPNTSKLLDGCIVKGKSTINLGLQPISRVLAELGIDFKAEKSRYFSAQKSLEKELEERKSDIKNAFKEESKLKELLKRQYDLNKQLDTEHDKSDFTGNMDEEIDNDNHGEDNSEEPVDFGSGLGNAVMNILDGKIDIKKDFQENVKEVKDLLSEGAEIFNNGKKKFKEWAAEMINRFTEKIKPHLMKLFNAVKSGLNEILKYAKGEKAFADPNTLGMFGGKFAGKKKPAAPAPDNLKMEEPSIFDKIRKKWQDKYIRIQRLIEAANKVYPLPEKYDARLEAELYIGRASKQISKIEKDIIKGDNSFVKRMDKEGISVDTFGEYLYADHAPERNDYLKSTRNVDDGAGMTTADALKTVSDLENQYPGIEKFADEFRQTVIEPTLAMLHQNGFLTDEAYDEMRLRYEKFAPLKGWGDEIYNDGTSKRGQGFSVGSSGIKTAKGRSSEAHNPFVQAIVDMEDAVVRVEKNKVGQSVLELVNLFPNAENAAGQRLWDVNRQAPEDLIDQFGELQAGRSAIPVKDYDFAVWKDGKRFVISIRDKHLIDGLKNLGTERGFGLLSAFNNLYRPLLTTMSPEFVLTNLARDFQEMEINVSGEKGIALGKAIAKDVPAAIRAVYRNTRDKQNNSPLMKSYEELTDAGGETGWFLNDTFEAKYDKYLKEVKKYQHTGMFKNGFHSTVQFIEDVNKATEMGTRLSVYHNLKKMGYSPKEAAYYAKNVTINFNKAGEWGALLKALYLFSGAGIQGSYRLMKAVGKSKGVRRILGGLITTSIILNYINRQVNNDEYEKLDPSVRDNSLIFMLPGDNNNHLKLPSTYGYSFFHAVANIIGDFIFDSRKYREQNLGDILKRLFSAAESAFNPLGHSGSILQFMSPTAFDPIVQVMENKDAFGKMIVKPQTPYVPKKPNSQMYFKGVRPLSKDFTYWLNDITGGEDSTKSGMVDVNPEHIDYAIDFLGGGVGKFIANSITTGQSLIQEGDLPPANKIPFIRNFVAPNNKSYDRQHVYSTFDESGRTKLSEVEKLRFRRSLDEMVKKGEISPKEARRKLSIFTKGQKE